MAPKTDYLRVLNRQFESNGLKGLLCLSTNVIPPLPPSFLTSPIGLLGHQCLGEKGKSWDPCSEH
jgi:hypothetical protein